MTLLSPTNHQEFAAPAVVTIQAQAVDSENSPLTLGVFGDHHLLGTYSNSPVSLVWSNVPPGHHHVWVRGSDAIGLKAMDAADIAVSH